MNFNFLKKFSGAHRILLISLSLVFATIAVYWRVGGFDFVSYDDDSIFFQNAFVRDGLTWKGIIWGATTSYYEYWHPLMWWSHMLDCQLFGMNAGGHHLVSLGFHVINTLLVFAIFQRMTCMIWRSAMVAALFALHPLHVESVAWLAERKDVLSSMFWLLSVWVYVLYVERLKSKDPRAKSFYTLALIFFLLGLLTKPMVVTLPFVLLLLDYWPLNRISWFDPKNSHPENGNKPVSMANLIREKIPFFALTLVFCFTTWYSVKTQNRVQSADAFPFALRLKNIPVSYCLYLWKTIWPTHLAVVYLMPRSISFARVAGSACIILAFSLFIVVRGRSARYLVFGWLAFLGVLVPTINLVPVGGQQRADRYMYLPSIGLFVVMVWATADLVTRWKNGAIVLGCVSLATLSTLGILASAQVQSWRDNVSLWSHCLATGSESFIAHESLGGSFLKRGEMEAALRQYKLALELDTNNPEPNRRLGAALIIARKPQEATNYIARALSLAPDNANAHADMGYALIDLGDTDGAFTQFSEAIRLDPKGLDAYVGLGKVLSAQGKSDEAVDWFTKLLRKVPELGRAHYFLGLEYLKRGMISEGLSSLSKSAESDPGSIFPHVAMAQACAGAHMNLQAIEQYRAALRLNPDLPEALNNLAWILATASDAQFRSGPEAVRLAERACGITSYQQTICIGTLAAAYAEAGQFDNAVQAAQRACDSARANGETDLLTKNQTLLVRFQARQPFHESN